MISFPLARFAEYCRIANFSTLASKPKNDLMSNEALCSKHVQRVFSGWTCDVQNFHFSFVRFQTKNQIDEAFPYVIMTKFFNRQTRGKTFIPSVDSECSLSTIEMIFLHEYHMINTNDLKKNVCQNQNGKFVVKKAKENLFQKIRCIDV